MMRRLAILLLGAAALTTAAVEIAAAADGCGRGRYWNGYRCATQPGYYGGQGYYGGPRYHAPYAQPYARYYGPPRVQGTPRCDRWGRCGITGPLSCGHPGYTVQDGVCKPYRGPAW
jgi:hypothetical protein